MHMKHGRNLIIKKHLQYRRQNEKTPNFSHFNGCNYLIYIEYKFLVFNNI